MAKATEPDSWTLCYAMGRGGRGILPAGHTDLEFWAYLCGVLKLGRVSRRKELEKRR